MGSRQQISMASMGNLQHVRLGSNLAGTRCLPQVGTSRPTTAVSLRVTCGQRLTGKVVSNKMDKTAVVEVERLVQHRYFAGVPVTLQHSRRATLCFMRL